MGHPLGAGAGSRIVWGCNRSRFWWRSLHWRGGGNRCNCVWLGLQLSGCVVGVFSLKVERAGFIPCIQPSSQQVALAVGEGREKWALARYLVWANSPSALRWALSSGWDIILIIDEMAARVVGVPIEKRDQAEFLPGQRWIGHHQVPTHWW